MKCGIVGLPNVGKSTLFNALTKAGIAAENYPFCTIEPNVGIVEVPDARLDALLRPLSARKKSSGLLSSSSILRVWLPVPAPVKAWATSFWPTFAKPTPPSMWCAAFEDDNVIHVAGKVDPISDIEVIQTELVSGGPGGG